MRILVVSALIGTNKSKSISKQEGHDVEFIFYNNANFPIRTASFTPRMNSKIPKMLAWMLNPGYDYYIWMDSNFSMHRNDSVQWFIENIGHAHALFFNHPQRSSIMDEAKFMVSRAEQGDTYLTGRIDGEPVLDQAELYCAEDWFEDDLLIAASSFCYRPSKQMKEFLRDWYFHTCVFSIRDQISLPYLIKKHSIDFKLINENVFGLKYLK
jgi:TOD1/MUCI70, glycosyltransferase-like domain